MTMQLFVRDPLTMIAAPVQGDVDGIPKGSHDSGVSHEISIPLLRSVCTAMVLFTDAIAASCVGLHGIVGMKLGIPAGIVPMMLLRLLRRGQLTLLTAKRNGISQTLRAPQPPMDQCLHCSTIRRAKATLPSR
jgi:hypothetical protein